MKPVACRRYPLKVTLTRTGFDPSLKFFNTGGMRLVYCPDPQVSQVTEGLMGLATVVGCGDPLDLGRMLDDLGGRGIQRLMVEGGGTIHTQFLTQGFADEIHLAVAPIFVGQVGAPRFVLPGSYPNDQHHRMTLAEVIEVGDVVVLRYLLASDGRLSSSS